MYLTTCVEPHELSLIRPFPVWFNLSCTSDPAKTFLSAVSGRVETEGWQVVAGSFCSTGMTDMNELGGCRWSCVIRARGEVEGGGRAVC